MTTERELPVWRSLMYVPVNVDKYVDKAHTRGADVIQLDIEDSVPPAEKAKARTLVEAGKRHPKLKLMEAFDRNGVHAYYVAEHHSTPLGLAPAPSRFVKPPRVARSPIALECKYWKTVELPVESGHEAQRSAVVFGQVPRIVLASVLAFWAGEFVNSYVMARMKVWTGGKHLWTRTIGSTILGEGVDSLIFYPVAFLGAEGFTPQLVVTVLFTQWALKVAWEVVLTPLTYVVVGALKRAEGVDVFDRGTDFTPFRARV